MRKICWAGYKIRYPTTRETLYYHVRTYIYICIAICIAIACDRMLGMYNYTRARNSTSHSTVASKPGMKLPKLVTNTSRLSLSLVRVTLAHSSQVVSDITEQVNLLIYVREALPISESRKKQNYCTV